LQQLLHHRPRRSRARQTQARVAQGARGTVTSL
jgi:hypothetical protein